VVNQYIGLIGRKRDPKETLNLARPVSHSVAIDPERNEEACSTGDAGVGHPEERPVDQGQLVSDLGEEVVVCEVVAQVCGLFGVDVDLLVLLDGLSCLLSFKLV